MDSNKIHKVRNSLSLSQASFGQLLGVHAMTVSKWERGVLSPNAYQATLLESFERAGKNSEVKGKIEGLLIGAGLAAALLLLLTAAKK
jgi:DNA-binding transcriptional regulator YiaG